MTTGKRTKKSESTKDAAAPEKEGKAPAAKAAAAKEAKPKKAAAPKKDAKKPADGKAKAKKAAPGDDDLAAAEDLGDEDFGDDEDFDLDDLEGDPDGSPAPKCKNAELRTDCCEGHNGICPEPKPQEP